MSRRPALPHVILVLAMALSLAAIGLAHAGARLQQKVPAVAAAEIAALGFSWADICGGTDGAGLPSECKACRVMAGMMLPGTIAHPRPDSVAHGRDLPRADRVTLTRRIHPTPPSRGPPVRS
ncbi:hypothetical protein [Marinibacterium sp. SX1]|uniref:hypothetical protein n=1 Tax=Marinibacterium sp. SX1 TaxID=3388424 RepID=UPI003D183516